MKLVKNIACVYFSRLMKMNFKGNLEFTDFQFSHVFCSLPQIDSQKEILKTLSCYLSSCQKLNCLVYLFGRSRETQKNHTHPPPPPPHTHTHKRLIRVQIDLLKVKPKNVLVRFDTKIF